MALRLKSDSSVTIKIDKLGRVVIPQDVRERLGLRPGTELRLVEQNDKAIYLELVKKAPKIVYKNGWPVVVSDSQSPKVDTVATIQQDREERDLHVAGYDRKKK